MKPSFKQKTKLFFASLFYGMKGGNDIISTQVDNSSKTEIIQTQKIGGVFADLLEEKETQQVKEVRDSYYRILKECDKYHVDIKSFSIGDDGDFEGDEIGATIRKKTVSDLIRHVNVYDDGLPIKIIQDNIKTDKHSLFCPDLSGLDPKKAENYDYYTLIDISRKDFTPTFPIEKLVSRIVVKEKNKDKSIIELSVPSTPQQFAPIASSVVNKLKNIMLSKRYRDELVDITGVKFVSEKPWSNNGSHSGERFEYDNTKLIDIIVYDGNFILRYECDNVKEFEYVGDKYKTKELDEKYETLAPKGDAVNIFALENLDKYKKNKNENSD